MPAGYKLRDLQQRCRLIEQHVRARSLATAAELDAYRPGGENNKDKRGWGPWCFYYHNLGRFNGRDERRQLNPEDSAADTAALMEMAEVPGQAMLTKDPSWPEKPVTVSVYPKSMYALFHLRAYEEALDQVAFWMNQASAIRTPKALAIMPRALEALHYEYSVLCWILTTEGPDLPFTDPMTPPEPPADFRKWMVEDFIEVAKVNMYVNGGRMQKAKQLCRSTREEGVATRPVFSVLLASLGLEHNLGWRGFLRDRSLGGLMTGVILGSDHRTAEEQRRQQEAELLKGSKAESEEPMVVRES